MQLHISRQHYDELLGFAGAAAPMECCGLFWGVDQQITRLLLTQNVAATPHTHFEIDPAALIAAEKQQRAGTSGAGAHNIMGYFHSHPGGETTPSETDGLMAAGDGRYWLIIADQSICAWTAGEKGLLHDRFTPVELHRQA